MSQLIGATEQRNVEVEEELSLALEETLEEDDLEDLPDQVCIFILVNEFRQFLVRIHPIE